MIKVFTDGGARGNPGPAATGIFVVDENGKEITKFGKSIGSTTNNVAEYKAVVQALDWIYKNKDRLGINKIIFFLDSSLICSQINGLFKVKQPHLIDLLFEVRQKENLVNLPIEYKHIPREENKMADRIVNMVLDNKYNLS